jgi:hypothetical protein
MSFRLTALGLHLSSAYKEPFEPKAVNLKFMRSFSIMDERIARLAAMKCGGKTNAGIKDAALRREFARELNDWRNQALRAGNRLDEYSKTMLREYSSSLYNGFWAMEKAAGREYYETGKRVTWALVEAPEPDANYIEYEQKVVELFAEIEGMKCEAKKRIGGTMKLYDLRKKKLAELQVRYGI